MKCRKQPLITLFVIISVLLLQACSSIAERRPVRIDKSEALDSQNRHSDLADLLGELNGRNPYRPDTSPGKADIIYRVVNRYTAASGKQCREVILENVTEGRSTEDLICRSHEGNWYWPRDVIFK